MTRFRSLTGWALGLGAYYLVIVYMIGGFQEPIGNLLRSVPDAREYLELGNWLIHGIPSTMIQRRTFLYPALAGLVGTGFGDLGIWLMQAGFWLASTLLFWLNLQTLVRSRTLQILALALYCLAITPIVLTLFAVTESLALLLFSILTFLLCRMQFRTNANVLGAIVLICGALCTVKPNYLPVYYGILTLVLVGQVLGHWPMGWRKFGAYAATSMLPFLIQIVLNRQVTGTAAISNIGHEVLQVSIYSQVEAERQGRDFFEVQKEVIAANPNMPTMLRGFAENPGITFHFYFKNLADNIRLVLHLHEDYPPLEHWLRRRLNDFFYWIHLAMILPLILALWRARRLRSLAEVQLYFLFVLFALAFLPTGISFWAADRWMAPLMGVWPILYLMTLSYLGLPGLKYQSKGPNEH